MDNTMLKYAYLDEKLIDLLNKENIAIEYNISQIFCKEIENNIENQEELKKIAAILSMWLDDTDKHSPYKPLYATSTHSSFSLDHITTEDAELFFKNIEKYTDNVIILARIFDVLWVTKKLGRSNYEAGEKAAKYWRKYIDLLLTKKYFNQAAKNVRRYISQALSLPRDSTERKQCIKKYGEWLELKITEENEYFLCTLYKLYTDGSLVDDKYAEIILTSAWQHFTSHLTTDNDLLLQTYVDIIICLARRGNKQNLMVDTLVEFAKYFKDKEKKETNIVKKINLLKKSIECFRKIRNKSYKREIDILQKEIEDLQVQIPNTMHSIQTFPIDITAEVKKSIDKITGKNTYDALVILARNMYWIDEDYVKNNKVESIVEKLCETVVYNQKGQPQNTSKYTIGENRCISIHYDLTFLACNILPMLDVFRAEHRINKFSLLNIVSNNPLVPMGYEKIYAIGLFHYLSGNYLEAAYILVPAFENSLRYLVSHNHPVSYFKDTNIEFDKVKIDEFIDILCEEKIIPPDIAFNLHYFFGSSDWNLRNNLMHGLYPYELINSKEVIVSLSLIYWLIMYPYIVKQ